MVQSSHLTRTTVQSTAETVASNTDNTASSTSASTAVQSTASPDTSKPQTYTAPADYTPVTSDIQAQEEPVSNNLIWIAVLSVAVAVGLVVDIINIKWIRKNKK